jgi:alpha-L-fucosidase
MNSQIQVSRVRLATVLFSVFIVMAGCQKSTRNHRIETKAEKDARMQWWRDARFGMFIHWGIYSVPAGVYGDVDTYGEWIMHHAQIPVEQYEKYAEQYNPVQFDADQWVLMAKDAGMKYIVITSKHHDGFCLWDSRVSDYDIIDRSPYKKDILKALSKACKKHDIKLCFYHSIMDWHHEDYLPRRDWEQRPSEGADLQRYIAYMKAQLKELVTQYDPAVLWFDGEWEDSWNHEEGLMLYEYVRSLKPDIIINNRVDKGRKGMQGLTKEGNFAGDFGTPEQEVPAGGLPGVDWESCITMNDHWGYCAADKNFKSTEILIHQLIEIVSKGGNYLLNVGPTSEGLIPPESVERLGQMGQWMKVNGEAIYGTKPWIHKRNAEEAVSTDVFFTARDDALYAITTKLPKTLALRMSKPSDNAQISMLGTDQEFSWKYMDGSMVVNLSEINKDTLPCDYAWVFKITN